MGERGPYGLCEPMLAVDSPKRILTLNETYCFKSRVLKAFVQIVDNLPGICWRVGNVSFATAMAIAYECMWRDTGKVSA